MVEHGFATNNLACKRQDFQQWGNEGEVRVAENEPEFINPVSLQWNRARYKEYLYLKNTIKTNFSSAVQTTGHSTSNQLLNEVQKLVQKLMTVCNYS